MTPPKKGNSYDRPNKKDRERALKELKEAFEDVPKEDMADQEEVHTPISYTPREK